MKTVHKKRDNHFLPICYQKAFTDDSDRIWVQYFYKNTPDHLHPKSVGKITKFYTQNINGVEDDSVEEFFSDYVEGAYARLGKKLRENRTTFVADKEDIFALARFVISQMFRTVAYRKCIDEQAGWNVNSEVFIRNIGRQMKKMTAAWTKELPSLQIQTSLPFVNSYFITGDNPVVIKTDSVSPGTLEVPFSTLQISNIDAVLASPRTEYVVPMSPYFCAVLMTRKHFTVQTEPVGIHPLQVSKINRDVCGQCVQFIAAKDKESLAFHRTEGSPSQSALAEFTAPQA